MRVYTLALVVRPSLSLVQRKKVVDTIKNILRDLKIIKENEVGLKPLAYKIKKEINGFYWDFAFQGENIPQNFEKKLLENENILRHLLLRKK